MKTLITLALAGTLLATAHARPVFVQESARLQHPDPANYPVFAGHVALDGDEAMISMSRYTPLYPEDDDIMDTAVWLFRRVNGSWTAVRQLTTDRDVYYIWPNGLAMRAGVAALALNPLQVFEKRNGEWERAPADVEQDEPGGSIAVDAGRIFHGGTSGTFHGTLYEKDAAGVWRSTANMNGEYRGGDDELEGREVDLDGSFAVVMSPYTEDPQGFDTPNVAVFFDFGPNAAPNRWGRNATLESSTQYPFGTSVQTRGDEVFVSGSNHTGTHVFRDQPTGPWARVDGLQPLNSYLGGGTTSYLRKSDLYVMQNSYSYDHDARVIHVFDKGGDGRYRHAATLVSSDGSSLGAFAISGRTVMASCGNEACVFDLPAALAAPARLQDTFGGSTPSGWTLSAGSQFSIVAGGASRVLRQSETASTATHTAVLSASQWTNQSIQADVRPTAFNGNDRWVGLATRYANSDNFYYVTLRSRNVNGSFAPIASAPLTVAAARTYRMRLESIGTRHRVYVNGVPVLDADDAALASGRAALLTYRAAADFDNVVASPSPTATLWSTNQPRPGYIDDFSTDGPGLWDMVRFGSEPLIQQFSVAGDARAAIGVPTTEQSVDVVARATTFAGTGEADRWFGVMTRYTDSSNFYYLTMRASGAVSLRKVANGQITVLGTAARAVDLGTWYRLRLESVGSQHRAYVNERLVLEASDVAHASGKTGIATFRTAADFLRYRAIQP